jgi:prolyl-tRNA synthetase
MRNFITGANQADAHYVHVNIGRDFTPSDYADVRIAEAGDLCPKCADARLEEARGIEVGHIFKLGEKYSGAMGANYSDADGALKPIQMGSYGIGISRILAALIEVSHDGDGIIWHPEVAPFHVYVVVANTKDEAAMAAGQTLHDELTALGVEVLLDDREERAGVKFKDADLIVEIRARKDAATAREVPVGDAAQAVAGMLQTLKTA